MRTRLRVHGLGGILLTLFLWGAAAPDSPIADAAMRGDTDAVRQLLLDGEDVNVAQGDGMTALHWVGEAGDAEMAEMLIRAGANIEALTRIGDFTPLHTAAEAGNSRVVTVLLEARASVEARTSVGGAQPIHFAAEAGRVEAVSALLDHGADPNARQQGAWGQTPLMFAASKNRVGSLQLLLDRGADPGLTSNVRDMARRATQDRMAGTVRDRVLNVFREASSDPVVWNPDPSQVQAAVHSAREFEPLEDYDPSERIDWEQAQRDGKIPRYADRVGHMGGLTTLLHAVREGHNEATKVLLDAGADVNQLSDGDYTSPLLMAMVNGHFDLGLELLARGADPNLASDAGATPLYATINQRWIPKARFAQQQAYLQQEATHIETMRALLEAGADPNPRLTKHLWYMEFNFSHLGVDTWGATPFWRAAHGLDVEAMRLLIEYGADPKIATNSPPNPPSYGDLGIDDRTPRDVSGLPPVESGDLGVHPIHVVSGFGGTGAARAGNSHMHVPGGWMPAVKYLVEEMGADVNLRDFMGYAPLHHAAGRGMNDVISYLVEKGADVMAVSRTGQTTVDMANGPAQGINPFPETIALLESMGGINNHACVFCQ